MNTQFLLSIILVGIQYLQAVEISYKKPNNNILMITKLFIVRINLREV